MKNITPTLCALAASVAVITAACAESSTKKAETQPDRKEQCRKYAEAQFKAVQPADVSGTTFQYRYDAKTGFCTVDVENKSPTNSFASRMSTNVLDASPTAVIIQQTVEPVRIVWKPAPQRLICDEVKKQKDGKLLCTPTKAEVLDPFWPLGW